MKRLINWNWNIVKGGVNNKFIMFVLLFLLVLPTISFAAANFPYMKQLDGFPEENTGVHDIWPYAMEFTVHEKTVGSRFSIYIPAGVRRVTCSISVSGLSTLAVNSEIDEIGSFNENFGPSASALKNPWVLDHWLDTSNWQSGKHVFFELSNYVHPRGYSVRYRVDTDHPAYSKPPVSVVPIHPELNPKHVEVPKDKEDEYTEPEPDHPFIDFKDQTEKRTDDRYNVTVLYYAKEDIFRTSADILVNLFENTQKKAISNSKESFLKQVRAEDNFLYILTHGLPRRGVLLPTGERVSWEELTSNVQSDILIVDTCFSGQIFNENNWLNKPSIIITSSEDNFYSYNPSIGEGRISLLVVALFTYFSDIETHKAVEDYLDIELSRYSERMSKIYGLKNLLDDLKYMHLKLYIHLLGQEKNMDYFITEVEKSQNIPFRGFSAIKYELNK